MAEQPIPFELHLTTNDLSPHQVEWFKQVCVQNDGKPLLIELAQGQHKTAHVQ
jgi:hypothetical protein